MLSRMVLAAAVAPLAAAFTVTVSSQCDYTVYGWNVVDSYGSGSPTFTLNAGNSWTGAFESKTGGGGPSLKLQKSNSLFTSAQQSQVEYDMAGSTLFYDLSNINGFPFAGSDVLMQTSNPSCPTVFCPASDPVCSQAYNQPNDLRTLACDGGANIEVYLCSSSASGGSSSSPAPAPSTSAPAPAKTTAAPPAPKPTTLATQAAAPSAAAAQAGGNFLETGPDGNVEVVVATTVVAVTSTVHVAGPSSVPEAKRDAHLEAHKHRGHSRVMGRHNL